MVCIYAAAGLGQCPDHVAIVSIGNERSRVTTTLTDGGPWDADGIANGWIVNAGGLSEHQRGRSQVRTEGALS